ncbi:hypothetical protein [Nocardioides bruguierae]|uniref:Uncharacterized protein n=1 Tax=Nocardioides bruguierae TaxID=2945102 RepID=A0A9X2D9W9_9ACTN|nr:hypothetical protein [Nocardioides bruguierae]MCM0621845.1 hypothetical protein [Nocardioides bruguierae]
MLERSHQRHRRIHLAAAGLALALPLVALTACSSSDEPGAESTAQAIPSDFVDTDDTEVLAEDGLPQDFPRDTVDLIDGEMQSASRDGKGKNVSFAVLISTDASAEEAVSDAISRLEAKGWEAQTTIDDPANPGPQVLSNDEGGQVVLTYIPFQGMSSVSYGIFP